MTYRTNAKPRRRRVVNWGAVGARALRYTLRTLEIAGLVVIVSGFVMCWRFVFTHIGSSKSVELAASWAGVVVSGIASVVLAIWLWDIGPEGRRSGRVWYRENMKRPVFEEREL